MPGRTRIAEAEIIARDRTGTGVKSAVSNFQQLHDTVRDNWWGVQNLGSAFAGLGAIVAGGFGVAAKASIDFEAGMAGVARTTRMVGESAEEAMDAVMKVGGVADDLRNIAITTPVDVGRLAAIAEEAGALGVARKDIAGFTSSISQLVATTNLTDASAAQLARIGGVMGVTASATDNLGSAILFAGRSTAATESEIVRFAQYLAPVAVQANATTGELIAMSAILPSLGQRADTARTTLSKAINLMGKAVRENGDDLQIWAGVAGKSTDDFAASFRGNGFDALTQFVEGLHRIGPESDRAAQALDAVGIREGRQRNVMVALAAAYDNTEQPLLHMRNALKEVGIAYDENTELTEAYKLVTGTTQAQIDILQNSIHDLGLGLMGVLLPPIGFVVEALQDMVAGLAGLPPGLKSVVVIGTAVAGVLGLMGGALLLLGPRLILVMGAYRQFQAQYAAFAASAANSAAIMATANNTTTTSTLRAAFAYGKMSAAQREAAFAAFQLNNSHKVALAMAGPMNASIAANNRATELSAALKSQEARQTALQMQSTLAATRARAAEAAAASAANTIKRLEIQQSAQLARAMSLEAAGRTALADRARAAAAATGAQIAALQAQVSGHLKAAQAASAQAASLQAAAVAQGRMAAATQAEISRLNAEAAAHIRAAEAAGAQAVALNVLAAKTSRAAVASAFLGKALSRMMTPLLILATVAGSLGWIGNFGDGLRDAAGAAADNTRFQAEFAKALQNQRAGMHNAIRDFIIYQMNQINGIAVAKRYGIEIAKLHAIINGSASGADTADFAAKLAEGAKKGDKEAAALYQTIGRLREAITNSGISQSKAAGATDAHNDALKEQAEAARQSKEALDELRETNDSINQALLALPAALLAQKEAMLAVEDAQEAYEEALANVADNAEEVQRAEADLLKARRAAEKSVRDIAQAEKDLATARERAADDYAEAQDKFADAQDSLIDANEKVVEAEEKLRELREGPSVEDLTEATNKLTAAHLKLRKAQYGVRDAQYMLNYLMAEGASARDIEEAQLALDEANQNVADSTADVVDATKELEELRNPPPAAIAKAERELESARRDVAEASRELKQAESELQQSRQDLANDTAYKDAEADLADARAQAAEASREVAEAEEDLRDARSGDSAARDLIRAELDLEQALYQQAEANVEVQKQTALSQGKLFGLGQEARALGRELGILGQNVGGTIGKDFANFSRILGGARADIAQTKDEIDTLADSFADEIGEIDGLNFAPDPFAEDMGALGANAGGEMSEGFISGMVDYFSNNAPILIATALIGLIVGAFALAGLAAIGVTGGIAIALALGAAALVAGLIYWISSEEHQQQVKDAISGLFDWLGGIRDSMDRWGKDVEQSILDWWNGLCEEMGEELTTAWSESIDWLRGIKDSAVDAKNDVVAAIQEWWGSVVDSTKAWIARRFVDMFNIKQWIREKLGLDQEQSNVEGKSFGQRFIDALVKGAKEAFFFLLNPTHWLIEKFNESRENAARNGQSWGAYIGGSIVNSIFGAFSGLGSLLGRAIGDALAGMPAWIKGPINSALRLWNWFVGSIAGISWEWPRMNIPGVGTIGGGTVGLGYLNVLKIPLLADGGITQGPMAAILGEAGQEAVIPLDELWRKFEPLFSMAEAMRGVEDALLTSSGVGGNTYNTNVYVETDADPYEIGREILWNDMTRVR